MCVCVCACVCVCVRVCACVCVCVCAAPIVTTDTDLRVNELANPLVPGSELIGMGIDIKVGLDLNALRRSCMRLRQVETMVLPDVNGVKSYSVPSWQIARRLFKADLTTKVFDSVQESLFDLAASAAVQFSVGMPSFA